MWFLRPYFPLIRSMFEWRGGVGFSIRALEVPEPRVRKRPFSFTEWAFSSLSVRALPVPWLKQKLCSFLFRKNWLQSGLMCWGLFFFLSFFRWEFKYIGTKMCVCAPMVGFSMIRDCNNGRIAWLAIFLAHRPP